MEHFNFKGHIDFNVRKKIFDLVSEADFYWLMGQQQINAVSGDEYISPIEGNYASGWIPNQDGGYSKNALVMNDIDNILTEKQREYNEKVYEDMLLDFMTEYNLEYIDYNNADLMELLQGYEQSTFDYAILEFRAYVKNKGVILDVVFDYGPDAEIVKQLNISIADFIKTPNNFILSMMATS